MNLEALVEGVLAGRRAEIGRAITLVESRQVDHFDAAAELLRRLAPHAGGAQRIGLTGVPGVGKSTFIERFGLYVIEQGHRVAVLAVDPTSSRTGGSILGDKTRMERLSRHDAAFIRPSPAGATLGGVAARSREAMLICEAAGFDVVIVETVGVGQSEWAVSQMTDVFVLLLLAGAGDELQGIKRGIMELADVVVINKADGEEAAALRGADLSLGAQAVARTTCVAPDRPRRLGADGARARTDLGAHRRASRRARGRGAACGAPRRSAGALDVGRRRGSLGAASARRCGVPRDRGAGARRDPASDGGGAPGP